MMPDRTGDSPSDGASGSGGVRHIPVLLAEVLEALQPKDGARYVDATYGAGGYTSAILEAADCHVTALDRDPEAIKAGFPVAMACAPRLSLMMARFSMLLDWAEQAAEDGDAEIIAHHTYDGIVFDLGVSSMQIDDAERGFSFQHDGPLDMRMSCDESDVTVGTGPSAAELVNTAGETQLADILYYYGEERRSRAIARAIVAARASAPITRTGQLVDIVTRVLGRPRHDQKHPATRTFQALRIAVNTEFEEIANGLAGAERSLKPGGRLVVVTFHSLEDRIVKRFLAERSGKSDGGSRHLPQNIELRRPSFRLVNQRPLAPGNEELERNPRSRSAKLRAAERLDAPAWPMDMAALGVPELDPKRRR